MSLHNGNGGMNMITALAYRHLALFFGLLFTVSAALVWIKDLAVGTPTGSGLSGTLHYLRDGGFVTALLAFLVGHHRTVNWLWSKLPVLNVLIAPNLNGTYKLETTSNWSLQQAMLAARTGQNAGPPSEIELLRVTGTLKIRLGLIRLRMSYAPSETTASRSRSEVLAASIHMERRSSQCELHYVYRSTVYSPKSETDVEEYFGAARFCFPARAHAPQTLEGSYWTNRSWQKGINTAGQAKATRI